MKKNSDKPGTSARTKVTFRLRKNGAEMRFARNNRRSVTVRLDSGLALQVKEAAREMGVSISDLHNMAIAVFLKRIKNHRI